MGWKGGVTAIVVITIAWALPLVLRGGGGVPSLEPGRPAPNFAAEDIATGQRVTLDQYRGEVVLLNIWATWCEPCKREMPAMERLYQEFREDGLQIVAVSVDAGGNEAVEAFVDEFDLSFDILHDPGQSITSTYQVFGLPESFVIDRRGTIAYREFGPKEWDSPESRERVRDLLARAP
jgi:cytochrome c biogenesis protein CcmG/thiol:disulfide interchange protein DsbE